MTIVSLLIHISLVFPHYILGLEGTWNILRPFGDVTLCCETEEPPLRLPSNEFELGSFLLEDGMERLLAYKVSKRKRYPCYLVLFQIH